jgi:hypothetical protein
MTHNVFDPTRVRCVMSAVGRAAARFCTHKPSALVSSAPTPPTYTTGLQSRRHTPNKLDMLDAHTPLTHMHNHTHHPAHTGGTGQGLTAASLSDKRASRNTASMLNRAHTLCCHKPSATHGQLLAASGCTHTMHIRTPGRHAATIPQHSGCKGPCLHARSCSAPTHAHACTLTAGARSAGCLRP